MLCIKDRLCNIEGSIEGMIPMFNVVLSLAFVDKAIILDAVVMLIHSL